MKPEQLYDHLNSIDRLIHEPARTSILTALYLVEEADFVYLMNKTGLSQGNLSSHMSKLEEAKLIEIQKTFKGKRPQTILNISETGSKKFEDYIRGMKSFFSSF